MIKKSNTISCHIIYWLSGGRAAVWKFSFYTLLWGLMLHSSKFHTILAKNVAYLYDSFTADILYYYTFIPPVTMVISWKSYHYVITNWFYLKNNCTNLCEKWCCSHQFCHLSQFDLLCHSYLNCRILTKYVHVWFRALTYQKETI